jgi:hypothetical protein
VCLLCNEKSFIFSADPWKKLCRRVQVFTVPGEHNTCVTTHIEGLAKVLNTHLSSQLGYGAQSQSREL